mgnify:CR=1 FL=1|tara:strand:+ start:231 stop:437 length:207 start_codon:yes stop_codon:yes gene_type:complete
MKLNPNNHQSQMETVSTLSKKIKGIKNALKQSDTDPFLYKEEEIIYLKRSLRDAYSLREELNKGNGFG